MIGTFDNTDLTGKHLLIRQDLNVPLLDGNIGSAKRIDASLPTLLQALAEAASVTVMSHLGRPVEGEVDDTLSLKPIADYLSNALGQEVVFEDAHPSKLTPLDSGIRLLENVRFWPGEKSNDETLAQSYAGLCDVFVMDAFGTAHRAQASTCGAGQFAPEACAGPLLAGEINALTRAMDDPSRPLVAIVGGSKVSTKLTVLRSLANVVDQLIVGGGIANTFIAAAGYPVGKSLYEEELLDEARALTELMEARGAAIPVPVDVICAKEFSASAEASLKPISEVEVDDMIFDIGPKSSSALTDVIASAGTIVWNGPIGVFEFDQFASGTEHLAKAVATSSAFSIAGGGDTIAAIDQFGVADNI
ncbi:MAG: phosphoglycerate kinase, partial [Proteobacteria bacterium]|nr:phosphoglycerate kinase [Pseudomonadota bacterium]